MGYLRGRKSVFIVVAFKAACHNRTYDISCNMSVAIFDNCFLVRVFPLFERNERVLCANRFVQPWTVSVVMLGNFRYENKSDTFTE